ncbi:MAG TPA: hypothetical protein VMF56_15860, partial [Acidobacteriaceae bacterium]|nr:hypothetical protein [Acidobacteriaceae bacterium]
EIERSLEARLFYLAVSTSLALPDICAALLDPDGKTNREKYMKFYDTWLRIPGYLNLLPADIYRLRCGIIHQGIAGHPGMTMPAKRIIFTVPSPSNMPGGFAAHGFTIAGHNIAPSFFLDAVMFCRKMTEGVSKWYEANITDPNLVANLPALVQYRPNGIAPYIEGFPVIA